MAEPWVNYVAVDSSQYFVVYGTSDLPSDTLQEVESLVNTAGGQLMHAPDFHAKVVISDSTVCITSFNFLYGFPFAQGDNAREIGIVVRGAGPADSLWGRFRTWLESARTE